MKATPSSDCDVTSYLTSQRQIVGPVGKSQKRRGHHLLHADHKDLFRLHRKTQSEWFLTSSCLQPPSEHTCSMQQRLDCAVHHADTRSNLKFCLQHQCHHQLHSHRQRNCPREPFMKDPCFTSAVLLQLFSFPLPQSDLMWCSESTVFKGRKDLRTPVTSQSCSLYLFSLQRATTAAISTHQHPQGLGWQLCSPSTLCCPRFLPHHSLSFNQQS